MNESFNDNLNTTGIEPNFSHFTPETKQYITQALCMSDACKRMNYKRPDNSFGGIPKNVPRNADICPDCEMYLFWRKIEINACKK